MPGKPHRDQLPETEIENRLDRMLQNMATTAPIPREPKQKSKKQKSFSDVQGAAKRSPRSS